MDNGNFNSNKFSAEFPEKSYEKLNNKDYNKIVIPKKKKQYLDIESCLIIGVLIIAIIFLIKANHRVIAMTKQQIPFETTINSDIEDTVNYTDVEIEIKNIEIKENDVYITIKFINHSKDNNLYVSAHGIYLLNQDVYYYPDLIKKEVNPTFYGKEILPNGELEDTLYFPNASNFNKIVIKNINNGVNPLWNVIYKK